jgi:hypothetical protein
MRSILFSLFVICIVVQVSNCQKQPPLWPEHFSQSYHISGDSGQLNTTAKIWYDYTNQLFKTQYDHGADT